MLKEIVIKILKYVNAKKLRIEKEVILDRKTSYSFSTKFEGKNKIGKNACINNSKVGFATYIGKECIFDNTIIGKYCCIANNVKVIVGKHPTSKFVSIHPAFFSTRKQARIYICK